MKRIVSLAVILAASLALSGCLVAESSYLKKVAESDAQTREITELRQKAQTLTGENQALKKQVEKLTGAVTELTGEKEQLSAESAELAKSLHAKPDELSRTIATLRQQIANLERENEQLEDDLDTLRSMREEIEEEGTKSYERLLESLKGDISHGAVTVSELQGRVTITVGGDALFASDKAEILPQGRALLGRLGLVLREFKGKKIEIAGHTDKTPQAGPMSTAWDLSAARAVSVVRFLQQEGVDPANLSAVAYDGYRPVADNGTPEGREKNRRVEIVLMPAEEEREPAPPAP